MQLVVKFQQPCNNNKIQMMKLQVIFFIVLIMGHIQINESFSGFEYMTKMDEFQSKWPQRIIKTIKNDPRIHQIMLLSNYKNVGTPKFVQDLQKNFPTLYFNDYYLKEEIHHFEKWHSLSNPRDTTLFIIVESPKKNNTQWTEEMMAFIKQLSTVRIRPKCLIFRHFDSNETSNYAKFLQEMWQDLFLDVTILDVFHKRTVIHQLNPFINSYEAKSFSKTTPLFPNKLGNLHRYQLKVGILYRPPYVKLSRNSTDHPVNVSGPDAEVGKIFAQVMNYEQLLIPSTVEEYGIYSCDRNKLTGFNSAVQRNEIQFIGVTSTTSKKNCPIEMFENTILAVDHYVAIAPILMTRNVSITVGETFYHPILLTFLITMFSWIIMNVLKFEKTIWNWTVVIEILFGISIETQPRKLKERIMFACFLVLNLYYSSSILMSLTDFNFRMDEEREINTLNDLMNSGLQFSSELDKLSLLPLAIKQDNFTQWVSKGRVSTYDECIELLLDYKNVTCIMRLSQAEWHAGIYREQNLLKFVPEFIISVGIGYFMEPGSPYVEKFEEIHGSLKEFGLLDRWKVLKIPNATVEHQLDGNREQNLENSSNYDEEWKILSLLIGLMISGYSASILSFFIELILGKWDRRRRLIT